MAARRQKRIRLFLLFSMGFLIIVMVLTVPTLRQPDIPQESDLVPGEPGFGFQLVEFNNLVGWNDDDISEAIPVFLRSCEEINSKLQDRPANPLEALGDDAGSISFAGQAGDWQKVCVAGLALQDDLLNDKEPFDPDNLARAFFEKYFTPVRIYNQYETVAGDELSRPEGTFTGYFEPVYKASPIKTASLDTPLYARPDDLVELDLGLFREELAGERIAGRVRDGRLYPYEDRAKINRGALDGYVRVLAWLGADDAFFLQIQGSGILQYDDGNVLRVGFAGQNGHPYTAIGKPLVARGEIPLERVSLQSIRDWLEAAPAAEAQALREENASFVFFTLLDNLSEPGLGPLGAQSVQLTPMRSLAADRRYHAMGTPVWVNLGEVQQGELKSSMRRLMIIQDTGGAIRGPVRGDVFWGRGENAKNNAGVMNAKGSMTVLLPNSVVARWRSFAS